MSIQFKMSVESYDVQPNGNIKMSSLLKMLQKAAGDDVNSTPLSFGSLASLNMAFVLTKINVEIYEDIKLYDKLLIISHPRKTHGVSFPRDFIVKAGSTTVAAARSMWVLLDLEKRTLLRPSAIDNVGSIPTTDEDSFEIPDVRRIVDANSLLRTYVQSVDYSHLDLNNHLNNTFYADFIYNCIDKISGAASSDKGLYMQINYKNEARLGDVLEIYSRYNEDENSYDFSASNTTSDKVCFTAFIKR